jgi:hypothetical protein
MMESFRDCIHADKVNDAVQQVTAMFHYAGNHMLQRGRTSNQPQWWDIECQGADESKHTALGKARISNSANDWNEYIGLRKVFKNLCKSKKRKINTDKVTLICSEGNGVSSIWTSIKYVLRAPPSNNSIDLEEWASYFKNMLSSAANSSDVQFEGEVDETLGNLGPDYTLDNILDGVVTSGSLNP